MSQQRHQYNQPLEVLIMFEPHRLQQQLLQVAYASVVPVSRRRLTTAHQPVAVAENTDSNRVPVKRGAEYE